MTPHVILRYNELSKGEKIKGAIFFSIGFPVVTLICGLIYMMAYFYSSNKELTEVVGAACLTFAGCSVASFLWLAWELVVRKFNKN